MTPDNDNKEKLLVARLKAGDSAAFEELYRLYSARLYNFVYSTLCSHELAEDITQICFTKIWEKKADLDITKNFSSYLYTIARNQVYTELERKILDARYLQSLPKDETLNSPTAEDNLHLQLMRKNINELIDNLPQSRKQIFIMSRFKGYSNKEIANQLSISERTVETQIYRALIYLKKKMKDYLLLLSIAF